MSTHLEGKNLVELLDLLEPAPAPPPVPLTPQTPGWVVLGLAVLVLLIWAVRHVTARRRANAYRRAALDELARSQGDAAAIAGLLRRTALAGFPRAQVAGLTGDDWLKFLDQSYGRSGFSTDSGRAMLAATYRQDHSDPALVNLAGDWIRHHHRGPS